LKEENKWLLQNAFPAATKKDSFKEQGLSFVPQCARFVSDQPIRVNNSFKMESTAETVGSYPPFLLDTITKGTTVLLLGPAGGPPSC
jgi:hypothetical protein